MRNSNSDGFGRKYSYDILLFTLFLIFIVLSICFQWQNSYLRIYSINSNTINNSFLSFFGIIFGFLVTALSILFSLREDSYFLQLISENDRNRNDIIGYFALGILASFVIVLLLLLLTVVYVPDFPLRNFDATIVGTNQTFLVEERPPYESDPLLNANDPYQVIIISTYFLAGFVLLNVTLLLVMFILLLRQKADK